MDLLASLTNALSQSSSLLGGLLSQIGGAGTTGNSLDNLFSDLVAQTPATPTTGAGAFVTAPAASFASSSALSSGSDVTGDASTSFSDTTQAIQAVGDITKILHKILYSLHQQNNASTSQGNNQANSANQTQGANAQKAADTQTTTANNATDPATSATQDTSSTNTTGASGTTASPTEGTQTLAEIVAELLLAMQAIIQNLQQIQVAAGGANPAQTVNALAATNLGNITPVTATNNVTTDTTAPAPPTPADKVLAEIWALLGAAANPADGAETAVTGALAKGQSAPTDAANPDSLLSALKLVEKSALEFISAGMGLPSGDTAVANNDTTAAASTAITVTATPDIFAKLTQIENTLKSALTHLQANVATQNVAPTTNTLPKDFVAAPADADKIAPPLAENTPQIQLAAAPAATVAPTSSNPPSAVTQTAAVFTADVKTGGDQNAGSDFLSGGNGSSSSATLNANANQSLTAEGAQATGTYNFASTLSAFRAANGGAMGLPSVIDQVILQMNRSVKNGNDQMSLQLQPGDLGKITVKLTFGDDGKVQGAVTADNPHTLEMLQKDSRSLERALQDAGLRADPGSLQFSLNSGQNGNASQTADGQNTGDTVGNGTQTAGDTGDGSTPVALGALAETYYITPTGVNIYV